MPHARRNKERYGLDFSSIHNRFGQRIYGKVLKFAAPYPTVARDPDLFADGACLAHNSLKPHYIRSAVDLTFYLSDAQRAEDEIAVAAAVDFALGYLQSRSLIEGARWCNRTSDFAGGVGESGSCGAPSAQGDQHDRVNRVHAPPHAEGPRTFWYCPRANRRAQFCSHSHHYARF
jgi:hypothetical protein